MSILRMTLIVRMILSKLKDNFFKKIKTISLGICAALILELDLYFL